MQSGQMAEKSPPSDYVLTGDTSLEKLTCRIDRILLIWQKNKLHIIKTNVKIYRYFILFSLSKISFHIILLKSMLFLIVSYRFHF